MDKGWWMNAKYAGRCAECNRTLKAGERIAWIPAQLAALCQSCGEEIIGEEKGATNDKD